MASLQLTSNLSFRPTLESNIKTCRTSIQLPSNVYLSIIYRPVKQYLLKAEAKGKQKNFRHLRRKDPMLDESEPAWPYPEQQEHLWKEAGCQVLLDAEWLMNQAENKFAFVLDIAEEATEYLQNNPEEALVKKPILKAISDRVNEALGMQLSDAYTDEWEVDGELDFT
eukprot:c23614_g1_i1 orf=379-882(+)